MIGGPGIGEKGLAFVGRPWPMVPTEASEKDGVGEFSGPWNHGADGADEPWTGCG